MVTPRPTFPQAPDLFLLPYFGVPEACDSNLSGRVARTWAIEKVLGCPMRRSCAWEVFSCSLDHSRSRTTQRLESACAAPDSLAARRPP